MIKLAVYGTLRQGHGNHGCLNGSKLLGTHQLKGFSMVSLGGFPAIDRDPTGSVLVEVYEADQAAEDRCNRLEGYNPNSNDNPFYDRVPIDTPFGEAHVYVMHGILERNYDRIESGDWEEVRQAGLVSRWR